MLNVMTGILSMPNIIYLLLLAIMANATTHDIDLWGYYRSEDLVGKFVPEMWFIGENNVDITVAHNDTEVTEPIYASFVMSRGGGKISMSFSKVHYGQLHRDFPDILIDISFTDIVYDPKANTLTMAVNKTTCGRSRITLKHERKVGGYFHNVKDFGNKIIFNPAFWGEDDSGLYLGFDNQHLKTAMTVKHTISSDWVISFNLNEEQKKEILTVCPVCFPPGALENMRYDGPTATISVPINSTFFGADKLLLSGR